MIKNVGKKKYLVRVYDGRTPAGKRRSVAKIVYGERSVAENYELELRQRKNQGQPLSESRLTLSAFFDEWRKAVPERMKEKSLIWYTSMFRKHVEPALGHMRLTSLKPLEVEQFYSEKLRAGYSSRTVEGFHSVLAILYSDATRWQYVRENPMKYVGMPKRKKKEMLCFNPDQARAYLAATYHVTYGIVLRTALQTGLRPEEYTGLKWPDMDFDYKDRSGRRRGRVTVRQTVIPGKPGGGWWWSDPKSESGYREVLFPLQLLQEVTQHRAQQREHKLSMGRHYQDHDLVFATPLGTPIDARMLSFRMHKKALEKAGLSRDFRLYDLRHSWVTLSILAGSDIKTVSQQAGHASTAFTMDKYGHVLPEMRESAVDRFEALLGGQ